MSVIGILTYLFGVLFLLSASAFAYYALRNTRLMRGVLRHRLIAAGSITSIVALIASAIEFLFFSGPIMASPVLGIWILAILLLVFGGISRAKDIRKVLKVSGVKSIPMLATVRYYLIGIIVLVFCHMPLRVLSLSYGHFGAASIDWTDAAGACTLAIAFVILGVGERRLYLTTRPSAVVVGSKEISLLQSDMLAVRGYETLTNTFLARVKPVIGDNILRKTLTDYFEYNPILFEGCILKENGTIDAAPALRNLDRIPRENRVQTVCALFSRLNSKLMNLYGAVTSLELEEKTLEDSYANVRNQYGDIPVLFDILRSMPKGVLENEKLALLSKEELEAKVRQRTQELEETLTELAEAKDYMDSIIKSMIDILISVDLEGRIGTINRVAVEILGYEEDELIGQPVNKIFAPAAGSLFQGARLERLIQGESVQSYEIEVRTKDGRIIPFDLNISPVTERGEVKAIQIVARDITERKRAEEALLDREEFNSSLLSNSPQPISVINPDTSLRYVNPAMAELTGFSSSELAGVKAPYPWWTEETLQKTSEDLREGMHKGIRKVEELFQNKDGKRFWVEGTGTPVKQKGQLEYYIVSWVDITESKQAEEELESSRQQLRDLARHMESAREGERTRIARELHDEMGQVLTALKMDLSQLNKALSQDQTPLREKTISMLELTDTAIKTVKRLATELRPGILDDLGLTAAIEWQAEEFQQRIGIKCEVSLYPEDINLDETLSTAIFRVLQETLTNVARHAQATRVKISLEEKAGKLVLQVIDNGRGITQKQISAPSSLGLVGMRERVLPWQGEVKTSGIRGEGTTVAVRIPLGQEVEIP